MTRTTFIGAGILSLIAFGAVPSASAADPPATSKALPPSGAPGSRPIAPSNPALMQQLSENLKHMQRQMDQLQAAPDSKERDRLIEEHRASMEEQLRLMQAMVGRGAINPMATGMGPGSVFDRRISQLEQRMDLLQQMMGQVIKHQEASQPPVKPPPSSK